MSKRTLLALCWCTGLLGTPAFADGQAKAPACCAQTAEEAATEPAKKVRCSLTGKVVDKCCCVEREGKTHCTLADRDVEQCCCTSVKAEEAK